MLAKAKAATKTEILHLYWGRTGVFRLWVGAFGNRGVELSNI